MKCQKCGKEIPDGENQLCDDCAKETDSKLNLKLNTKKIILCLAIILVLIILCIIIFRPKSDKVGNTIGNIRNYGYVTSGGKWIYYLAPNEDSTKVNIFRIKKNGTNKESLFSTDLNIISINYYKGYLYFIGMEGYDDIETTENSDVVDNKIYRIKADGSKELEVINDNDFNNDCYEIYVIKDYIYYIGLDQNVYKMKLDGSDSELVKDNGTGYLGMNENYIIYNAENTGIDENTENPEGIDEDSLEESESVLNHDEYVTCVMNIDGSNSKPIIKGKRLYSVNINGDYVYYTDSDKKIYKTKIGSEVEELVLDTSAYNLNYYKGYLYYFNYDESEDNTSKVCIFRVKANGKGNDKEKIKELDTYSSFLDIASDRIVYMDSNDNHAYIKLLNLDGSHENIVYDLDYNTINNTENAAIEDTEIVENTEIEETDEEIVENTEENVN